jgi:hypothetical protein
MMTRLKLIRKLQSTEVLPFYFLVPLAKELVDSAVKLGGPHKSNSNIWSMVTFNKCIRDYLEAVAGFPNICNQLILWLHTAKKPALMPMHEFMLH